jgi:hypothetical protein
MLVSSKVVEKALQVLVKDKPWSHLVDKKNAVAANAARRTIRILIESADVDSPPTLGCMTNPLNALYVLIVQVVNYPESRMTPLDVAVSTNSFSFFSSLFLPEVLCYMRLA